MLSAIATTTTTTTKMSSSSSKWKNDYFECNNASALRVLLKMPNANALARRERHETSSTTGGGKGGGGKRRTYLMEQMQKGNSATVGELFLSAALEERTRKELLLARDENGSCCLHYAVYGASAESMKCLEMVLLECERRGERLDMAVKDFVDGSTPLILSAFTNDTFVIEKTLELTRLNGQQDEVLYERDNGKATIAGHLAQRARGNEGMTERFGESHRVCRSRRVW